MIWQDFTYALRLLSKKPGFTVLTTLVMATGIGLSVFMFSFFNTVLFKDLPFEDGGSLVVISGSQQGKNSNNSINLHDYLSIRNNVKGLSEFGAYRNQSVIMSARDGARRYPATFAEANIFQLTRTKPILGRGFTPAESQEGAERVVVIGYELWQNQFAGDEQVIKQSLKIDGNTHQIIGVMPQGYLFPSIAKMWLPLRENANQLARGDSGNIRGLAHLDSDSSLSSVNNQLSLVMQKLAVKYPQTNSNIGAYVTSIPGSGARDGIAVVYSMYAVAVLILILASINVSNLLLSRAIERSKETAIRVALGAPRLRLITQMLWESAIICSVGALIGLLVMAWGLEITEGIVATFFSDPPAFWWKFGLDSYTIKLFLTILVGTIFVTGLLPAWKSSGGDFNAVLRDGTRGALGKKSGRLSKLLVISEIFISITVLIAAAVMVFASYMQSHQDIGAETDKILVADVLVSAYDLAEKKTQFVNTLQSRLENSAGISEVMISSAPPGHYSLKNSIAIEGQEYSKNTNVSYPEANYISVMPGSLEKFGVELRQGRYFDHSDDGLDKATLLVSEIFANRHFPNQSAIGKRVRVITKEESEGSEKIQWLRIVGVVENTIQGSREERNIASIYQPYSQAPRSRMTVAMKMTADQLLVTKSLRQTLLSIDPELPSYRVESYAQSNNRITAPIQFTSNLTALFALAALVLAASGIYGVMANTISQRTQEIGIKRALGADEGIITKEFIMTGIKLLLIGGVPGLMAGSFMGFAMSNTFGIGISSLVVIAAIMVVLIGSVVLLATYLPTKQALQLEPSQALHYQ